MTLLIDAGNTRIKFGWCFQDQPDQPLRTLAVLAEQLEQLAERLQAARAPLDQWRHAASPALGVNVAGAAVQESIQRAVEGLGVGPIHWLSSQRSACGVHNDYRRPEQLGTDRWAALVGLHAHTQDQGQLDRHPLILASFGTATTIDSLAPKHPDGSRRFPGGLILPGPSLMLQALAQNTAQLPLGGGQTCKFPQDTLAAIASGVAASQAGAVLRQWQVCLQHYGQAPKVYLSGGGLTLIQQEVQGLLDYATKNAGLAKDQCLILEAPVLSGLAQLISLYK